MKRGEMLYPHAYTIAAALLHCRNDASIPEVFAAVGERGPDKKSYHQILNHLRKQGYVERRIDEVRTKDKLRWSVTDQGIAILRQSTVYYRFALSVAVGTGQLG